MEASLQDIKDLFNKIGRDDINENSDNLVDDDIIDSVDMMKLMLEIEKILGKPLDSKYILPENFKNFNTIKTMLASI